MASFALDHADFANQGGFNPNPAVGSKPNSNGGIKQTSLRALTIKQLAEAYANPNADLAVCDGHDVDDVTVVGKCVSFQITATVDEYIIDDGTGKMSVKWFVDDATDAVNKLRADCAPGNYIRVDGSYRPSDGASFLQAYSIKPITDHNEVTHHLLSCIFQHLSFVRKPQAGAGTMLNGNHAPVPVQNNSGMAANPNFNPCQRAITELMMTKEFLESDTGITKQIIVERLAPQFAANHVYDNLQIMTNEGHIYTTVDEDHLRACI